MNRTRLSLVGAAVVAALALGGAFVATRPASAPAGAASAGATAARSAPSPTCRLAPDQRFAWDLASEATLTFDEDALLPSRARPARAAGDPSTRTESAKAKGRLEAKVVAASPGGDAIVATRLLALTADRTLAALDPAAEKDVERPYLLRVTPTCRVVATARQKTASVLAYRRVIGHLDRMDFAVPAPGANPAQPYLTRQTDEYGAARVENRFARGAGDGRGTVTRKRLAYDATKGAPGAMNVSFRVKSAGGEVRLGASAWFERIVDAEDIEAVAGAGVPYRSRASERFDARDPDPRAWDGVRVAIEDFVWGRPTEAELADAAEALRGKELAGLAVDDAWARYLALRDGGTPGAWHDAQRLLRAWMKANPAGVKELVARMKAGKFARKDQADLALALAKSGSAAARDGLEALASDKRASNDLRVQATSACADLTQPTKRTVETLADLASAKRNGDAGDMVASAARMAMGTILESAPGSEAAEAARGELRKALDSGDPATVAEALWAASNSGDAAYVADAERFAQSQDERERGAAAHALRKVLPSEKTTAVLSGLLRDDTNPEVVKEAVGARREQIEAYGGQLDEREISLLVTKLPTAPEGVRWEIVRLLGSAARLQPAAMKALVDWYPHEPVQAVRVLIGQYVPASELAH